MPDLPHPFLTDCGSTAYSLIDAASSGGVPISGPSWNWQRRIKNCSSLPMICSAWMMKNWCLVWNCEEEEKWFWNLLNLPTWNQLRWKNVARTICLTSAYPILLLTSKLHMKGGILMLWCGILDWHDEIVYFHHVGCGFDILHVLF